MVWRRNSSLEKLKIPDKKVPTLAAFRNIPFKMLLELTKQKNVSLLSFLHFEKKKKNAEKDTINLKNNLQDEQVEVNFSLFFTGKLHNDLPEQRALTLSRQRFYVIGTSVMKELMASVVSQIRWINSMTEVF